MTLFGAALAHNLAAYSAMVTAVVEDGERSAMAAHAAARLRVGDPLTGVHDTDGNFSRGWGRHWQRSRHCTPQKKEVN